MFIYWLRSKQIFKIFERFNQIKSRKKRKFFYFLNGCCFLKKKKKKKKKKKRLLIYLFTINITQNYKKL